MCPLVMITDGNEAESHAQSLQSLYCQPPSAIIKLRIIDPLYSGITENIKNMLLCNLLSHVILACKNVYKCLEKLRRIHSSLELLPLGYCC